MEENVLVFRKHPLKHVGVQLTLKWPRKNTPRERRGGNDRLDGAEGKTTTKIEGREYGELFTHFSPFFSRLQCLILISEHTQSNSSSALWHPPAGTSAQVPLPSQKLLGNRDLAHLVTAMSLGSVKVCWEGRGLKVHISESPSEGVACAVQGTGQCPEGAPGSCLVLPSSGATGIVQPQADLQGCNPKD